MYIYNANIQIVSYLKCIGSLVVYVSYRLSTKDVHSWNICIHMYTDTHAYIYLYTHTLIHIYGTFLRFMVLGLAHSAPCVPFTALQLIQRSYTRCPCTTTAATCCKCKHTGRASRSKSAAPQTNQPDL